MKQKLLSQSEPLEGGVEVRERHRTGPPPEPNGTLRRASGRPRWCFGAVKQPEIEAPPSSRHRLTSLPEALVRRPVCSSLRRSGGSRVRRRRALDHFDGKA